MKEKKKKRKEAGNKNRKRKNEREKIERESILSSSRSGNQVALINLPEVVVILETQIK